MNRKRFLEICGMGMVGALFAGLAKWVMPGSPNTDRMKEARFYRQADELAG